jgi:hypothetical protein
MKMHWSEGTYLLQGLTVTTSSLLLQDYFSRSISVWTTYTFAQGKSLCIFPLKDLQIIDLWSDWAIFEQSQGIRTHYWGKNTSKWKACTGGQGRGLLCSSMLRTRWTWSRRVASKRSHMSITKAFSKVTAEVVYLRTYAEAEVTTSQVIRIANMVNIRCALHMNCAGDILVEIYACYETLTSKTSLSFCKYWTNWERIASMFVTWRYQWRDLSLCQGEDKQKRRHLLL